MYSKTVYSKNIALKKYLLLGVGVCLFFLTSCNKEKDNFVPYELDGSVSNLIKALSNEGNTFSVAPATDQIIKIDEKAQLKVNASSLLSNGNTDIRLQWQNANSAIDMELLALPNFTNGKYLVPVYSFQIEATQEDAEIGININSPMELRIESNYDAEAGLFFLSNEGWSSMGSQGLVFEEWIDENGQGKSGYRINIAQKGWYSISTKVDLSAETFSSFCIELSGEYTQGNTKSFVVLENEVVAPMTRVRESGSFCTTMNIPNNQPMKLVVMSNLRENIYQMFFSEQIMENGLIVAPIMEEKSIDEIKSILENI